MSTHDPRLDVTDATAERVEVAAVPDTRDREDRLGRILTGISLAAVAGWAAAILSFGWMGLFLPALVALPVLFVLLFLITRT